MRTFPLILTLSLLTLLLSQSLYAANTANLDAKSLSNQVLADETDGEKEPEGDEEPDCD